MARLQKHSVYLVQPYIFGVNRTSLMARRLILWQKLLQWLETDYCEWFLSFILLLTFKEQLTHLAYKCPQTQSQKTLQFHIQKVTEYLKKLHVAISFKLYRLELEYFGSAVWKEYTLGAYLLCTWLHVGPKTCLTEV